MPCPPGAPGHCQGHPGKGSPSSPLPWVPTSRSTDPGQCAVGETGSAENAAPLQGHFIWEHVGGLGLLRPQQCPHLADLPVDTGTCGATQGCVLLHTVPVVPHMAHVT